MKKKTVRALLLASAICALATMLAGPSLAQGSTQCERNEQGQWECYPVDENGDRIDPPPPPDPNAPQQDVPLDLISDLRRVYNTGTQCYGENYSDPCETNTNSMSATGFQDFDGSAWAYGTGAFQTSHLHDDELLLEGSVFQDGYAGDYFAYSYSLFDVEFSVANPTLYSLEWEIDGFGPGELYLEEDGARIFEWDWATSFADYEVFHLLAGKTYRLYHRLESYETADHPGTEYRISFTPVPEPGTALLVGGGIAWLARGRSRRRACGGGRG